jgi:hypothetical protein
MQEAATMSQESAGFASRGQEDFGRMQDAMPHIK